MPANQRQVWVSPVRRARPCPAGTSELEFARKIATAFEPNAGTPQRREEFHDAFAGTDQSLEFIGGHDDGHRLAMARDRLRSACPGQFDNLTELVLCVLQRPCFHGEDLAWKFWPVKLEFACPLREIETGGWSGSILCNHWLSKRPSRVVQAKP